MYSNGGGVAHGIACDTSTADGTQHLGQLAALDDGGAKADPSVHSPTSFAVACSHPPSGRVWCFSVCTSAGVKRRRNSPLSLPAINPPPPSSAFFPPTTAGLLVAGRAGPLPSLAPMQIGRSCAVHLSVSSLQATLPPAVDVFGFSAKAPS